MTWHGRDSVDVYACVCVSLTNNHCHNRTHPHPHGHPLIKSNSRQGQNYETKIPRQTHKTYRNTYDTYIHTYRQGRQQMPTLASYYPGAGSTSKLRLVLTRAPGWITHTFHSTAVHAYSRTYTNNIQKHQSTPRPAKKLFRKKRGMDTTTYLPTCCRPGPVGPHKNPKKKLPYYHIGANTSCMTYRAGSHAHTRTKRSRLG